VSAWWSECLHPPDQSTVRARRALIVDDEADRRDDMLEGLRDHGVQCEDVATLEEALRRLAVSSYDLVVCDLILCDPPEASNPALRGYLAVCFALARSNGIVVQASSQRRWFHPGAVLTNFRVDEVANLIYGHQGIPSRQSADGGCPWSALTRAARAPHEQRRAAADEVAQLPIVRVLEGSLQLGGPLAALEDAAEGLGDWSAAVAAVRRALFPGVIDEH
jgi:hypothetical protein